MNAVQLTGRLTTEVEFRTTDSGTEVASLRLAVQRPRREGEDQGADYVDVIAFSRLAETCAQYLAKGRKVAVEGRLRHHEWDGDNGRRQKLEVIANSIEFLDSRKTDDSGAQDTESAAA
jgi:single-strand DNA-binding protein